MDTILKVALVVVILASFVALVAALGGLSVLSGNARSALDLYMTTPRDRFATEFTFYKPATLVATLLAPLFGYTFIPDIAIAIGSGVVALLSAFFLFMAIRKLVAW